MLKPVHVIPNPASVDRAMASAPFLVGDVTSSQPTMPSTVVPFDNNGCYSTMRSKREKPPKSPRQPKPPKSDPYAQLLVKEVVQDTDVYGGKYRV
jgi:hypothetical protein